MTEVIILELPVGDVDIILQLLEFGIENKSLGRDETRPLGRIHDLIVKQVVGTS